MHFGYAGSFAGLGCIIGGDLPLHFCDLGGPVVADELVDARLIGDGRPLIAAVVDIGDCAADSGNHSQHGNGADNPFVDAKQFR
ncbi:hypothetical protein ACCS87_02600 [Rhizobium ruizarguesonis]